MRGTTRIACLLVRNTRAPRPRTGRTLGARCGCLVPIGATLQLTCSPNGCQSQSSGEAFDLVGHNRAFPCSNLDTCAVSADFKFLLGGGFDGRVTLRDLRDGEEVTV